MNKFKKARLIAGLTQVELAEKVGVSPVAVHRWESGLGLPRVKRLNGIADALHTTVADLIDEERAV